MNAISRRGWGALSLAACIAGTGFAQSAKNDLPIDKKTKVQQSRDKAVLLLQKIETGRNPCYSDECQTQKLDLLQIVFKKSGLLPEVGKLFLSSRDSGIDAGYRLVRKRFAPPPMKNAFPTTVKEWRQWWVKRYDHELETRSNWMKLTSDVYALQQGLKVYLDIAKSGDEQKNQIEEAWERGLSRAAQLLITFPALVREASQAEEQKQTAVALTLRREAAQQIDEFNRINQDQFRGQFYSLLQAIIPQARTQEQAIAFLVLTQRWMNSSGSKRVFDPSFVNELKYRYREIVDLTTAIQSFNDLEYGIVGLKNFYSDVNPAVRTELELIYQGFLDQVDDTARQIVDLGAFCLLSITGAELIGPGFLGRFGFPTAVSLVSNQYDFNATEILWSRSTRTHELSSRLSDIEADMDRRRAELFEIRKLLKIRIEQYDQELNQPNQGDSTHEPT